MEEHHGENLASRQEGVTRRILESLGPYNRCKKTARNQKGGDFQASSFVVLLQKLDKQWKH